MRELVFPAHLRTEPRRSWNSTRRCVRCGGSSADWAGFSKYEVAEDLQEYLRDVADHAASALEESEGFRLTLRDVLALNAALVAQRQNEEMKGLAEASNVTQGART